MKRLSMSGLVEDCTPPDSNDKSKSSHSGDSRDNTSIDDTSFSSTSENRIPLQKKELELTSNCNSISSPSSEALPPPNDDGTKSKTPRRKPPASRRRSSVGGSDHDIEIDLAGEPSRGVASRSSEDSAKSKTAKRKSGRRRSSLFGGSSHDVEVDLAGEKTAAENPPSQRRWSLFDTMAAAAAVVAAEDDPSLVSESTGGNQANTKPKSSRRRKFFGKSKGSTADETTVDDPSLASESTGGDQTPTKPKSTRRRSFFGNSKGPSLDETIGRVPPRRDRSGNSATSNSHASGSSRSPTRRSNDSAETPPRSSSGSGGRGVDRAKSLDSPLRKRILKGTFSFNGKKDNKPKTNRSNRSLFSRSDDSVTSRSSFGTKNSERHSSRKARSTSIDEVEAPGKPRSSRRHSLAGSSNHSGRTDALQQKPASRRRSSLTHLTGDATSIASASVITNPHDLVNRSRQKRGLKPFSRNMLMDTIAKQVAQDLAVSSGAKCTPTNYHGNVGQGETIQNIHKTMMSQKGGTARSNLLSTKFEEIGIGISRGKDDLIYMCQLFK